MGIPDEFRRAIAPYIPKLVTLLTDSTKTFRSHALAKLYRCITPLIGILADFQPVITEFIPKLVTLLTDDNYYVRSTGANALARLSETGKQI